LKNNRKKNDNEEPEISTVSKVVLPNIRNEKSPIETKKSCAE